jgi:hypothetical protein
VDGGRLVVGAQPAAEGVDQSLLDGVDRVVAEIVERQGGRVARDLVGQRHEGRERVSGELGRQGGERDVHVRSPPCVVSRWS